MTHTTKHSAHAALGRRQIKNTFSQMEMSAILGQTTKSRAAAACTQPRTKAADWMNADV